MEYTVSQEAAALDESLRRLYTLHCLDDLERLWQGEPRLLCYLYRRRHQETRPLELSRYMNVSRARITAALGSLRKKGLITVLPSQKDHRCFDVQLTESGEKEAGVLLTQAHRRADTVLQHLGEQNARELTRLLLLTAQILERENEDKALSGATKG